MRVPRHILQVMVPATLTVASLLGAMPAYARSSTEMRLIRSSLEASLLRGSVHAVAGLTVSTSAKSNGIVDTVTVKGHIRGDLAVQNGEPAARVRAFGLGHQAKAVVLGNVAAYRVGHRAWQCASTASSGVNPGSIRSARHILRFLRHSTSIANLGPAVFRGHPVWHLRATTTVPATAGVSAFHSVMPSAGPFTTIHIGPTGPTQVVTGFWIDRTTRVLRKLSMVLTTTGNKTATRVAVWIRLSRYANTRPITLPSACAA